MEYPSSGIESHFANSRIDQDWEDAIQFGIDRGVECGDIEESEVDRLYDSYVNTARKATEEMLETFTFITSESVAALMARSCPDISVDEVRLMAELGLILSVPWQGRRIYPDFQFSPDGLPHPVIKDVFDEMPQGLSAWSRLYRWTLTDEYLCPDAPYIDMWRESGPERVTAFMRRFG